VFVLVVTAANMDKNSAVFLQAGDQFATGHGLYYTHDTHVVNLAVTSTHSEKGNILQDIGFRLGYNVFIRSVNRLFQLTFDGILKNAKSGMDETLA
jgi:hypothetical protein